MSCQPCKKNSDEVSNLPAGSLYFHIPFCREKCKYCDFFSLPAGKDCALNNSSMESYVKAALLEFQMHRHELAPKLETVFFGGGTPTVLGPELLEMLLDAVAPLVTSETEISVEANPGAFSSQVAQVLAAGKVNRVNFGVQSFNEQELKLLGRIHDASQARDAIAVARQVGIQNVGLDLIYGIPGQTLESWKHSLDCATELAPSHLSCYALSFEKGTPLGQDLADGKIAAMDDDTQKACYELAIETAAKQGLEHYEISNFALSGKRCRHNMVYWQNRTYLGIGPAAASYICAKRRTNLPDMQKYLQAINSGASAPAEVEELPLHKRMAETLMLALRMVAGVDLENFKNRFGMQAGDAFPNSLSRYTKQGALIQTKTYLRLAKWAFFASDTILADIIAENPAL